MQTIRCWAFPLLLFLSSIVQARDIEPIARQGVVDLSAWDFERHGPVTLNGEWAFYWQKLLRPNAQNTLVPPPEKTFRSIPGYWSRPDPSGEIFPVQGYGSYHLRIKTPKRWTLWALDMTGIWSAGEVYVNGQLVFQSGRPDVSRETTEASQRPVMAQFEIPGDHADIVITMSNYVHGRSGFTLPRFGPAVHVTAEREKRLGLYCLILGTIFFMGIYHLGLYGLRPGERSPLYFAASCAANGVFTLVMSGFIFNLSPNFDHDLWWKLLLISWYLGYPAFSKFARSLFPHEFSGRFVGLSVAFGLAASVWVLLTPAHIAERSSLIMQFFGLFHFAYLVHASVRAAARKRPHALLFLAGTTIYYITIIHDILVSDGIIDAPLISSYGLAVFFLFQSYLLAVRFSQAFIDLEAKEAHIIELNEGLERMVDEKTRDIRSILESIQQGIFMIRRSASALALHPDYSAFLQRMLKGRFKPEEDPLDQIFERASLSEEQKSINRSIVEASLGEPAIAFEMNQSHLPTEVHIVHEDQERAIWDIDWTPVLNADGAVDKILVSLRDVTRMRELQEDAIEGRKELEYISEIVNVSAANFESFIRMSRGMIDENRRLILQNHEMRTEVVKILFINMHTIKGNARGCHFRKMSSVLHDVEHRYAELLNNKEAVWDQVLLLKELQSAAELIEKYDAINRDKLDRHFQDNVVMMERQLVARQIDSLSLVDLARMSPKDRGIITEAREAFRSVFYNRTLDVFEDMLSDAERLARDLKKSNPTIVIDDPGFGVTQEAQELLKNIFIHIVRNSLDHGIESDAERVRAGKCPSGMIEVRLSERQGMLVILYRDDGRGLNMAYLRELGLKTGVLTDDNAHDPKSVADLIFVAGLSTSTQLTEISGRGMGMDAVRSYILKMGGSLRIVLDETTGKDQAYWPFAFEIGLPAHFFSRDMAPSQPAA